LNFRERPPELRIACEARRLKLAALALLLLCGMPALAQEAPVPSGSPFSKDPGMDGDSVRPINSYALGESEDLARSMLASLRMEKRVRNLCWEIGCVVFVNESNNYMVTGFFVQQPAKKGGTEWSRNQFLIPLLAQRVTFRFKTGNADACDLPARFVLRAPHSKETISYDTRISLCSTPHRDSLVRIKAVTPEVRVGEPAAQ
jgi:hypothetical protein